MLFYCFYISPFDAEAPFLKGPKKEENFQYILKSCHIRMHWKALDEYYQMSTHLPGFQ